MRRKRKRMITALYKNNTMGWVFIVLDHLNNSVAPLRYIILIQSEQVVVLTP